MRSDKNHDHYFSQQSKLPGPGSYRTLDPTGQTIYNSTMRSSMRMGIAKADNRFCAPTVQTKSPSPDKYQPQQSLGLGVGGDGLGKVIIDE